jgi:hypothetical protein
MSYFHEYFLDNGVKTLRKYSRLLNLNVFEENWMLEDGDLWGIDEELDKIRHYDIAPKEVYKNFRLVDKIERNMGKIIEWPARNAKA